MIVTFHQKVPLFSSEFSILKCVQDLLSSCRVYNRKKNFPLFFFGFPCLYIYIYIYKERWDTKRDREGFWSLSRGGYCSKPPLGGSRILLYPRRNLPYLFLPSPFPPSAYPLLFLHSPFSHSLPLKQLPPSTPPIPLTTFLLPLYRSLAPKTPRVFEAIIYTRTVWRRSF